MATAKPKTKAQLQADAKKLKASQAAAAAAKAKTEAVSGEAGGEAGEINLQNLTHIVTATNSELGFCFATVAVAKPLFDAGMVDVNGDAVNPTPADPTQPEYATRATPAGIAYVASKASPFAAPAAPAAPAAAPFGNAPAAAAPTAPATRAQAVAPEGGFKIVTGVPLPVVTRSFGPKKSIYPFGTLEVGASFFVPSTAARPNPAKQMASTVNSATSRFSVEDGTEMKDGVEVAKFKKTRTFALRGIDADMTHADGSKGGAPWGYPGQGGAAVFRTA